MRETEKPIVLFRDFNLDSDLISVPADTDITAIGGEVAESWPWNPNTFQPVSASVGGKELPGPLYQIVSGPDKL